MLALKHSIGDNSSKIDWDYQKNLSEFNKIKQVAIRGSDFQITPEFNFGFSSLNPYQSCMINLPKNKLGTWIVKTMNNNIRTWEWTILDPMSNTAFGTGLVVSRNTSYNNWTWLWSDGMIYTVACQDKKLYRFKPDGSGYEFVMNILTPNNATSNIYKVSGMPIGDKVFFVLCNQSNTTAYLSYIDMKRFTAWNGSISGAYSYIQPNGLMLPNGNIMITSVYGGVKIYSISDSNTFTYVRGTTIGSYVSTGFCQSCPFAGTENWVYNAFIPHGSSVIAYNYETGATKTTSHYKPSYENQYGEQGQLLPTGEIFTWMQLYGSNNGLKGNGAIIYNFENDASQICVPSDGNTSTRYGWNSRLLQNGKIFIFINRDNLIRGKLLDIGLNKSFDYNLLTHPWFGCGCR